MTTPTSEILALQLAATNAPLPQGTTTSTNPLLPDVSLDQRMANFPEEVYDLKETSHLKRLMTVLLGDTGVGQSRKRLMLNRLAQTIQGTHFYDLDRFYGALFGVRRVASEFLNIDPANDVATSEQWAIIHAKDASYRSRIIQFARAITYGGTPTGMELVAEALLSVDCDVYETYSQADASYLTYGEIEANYNTYADMEGVYYAALEGEGLPRLAGNDRRTFTVRPKRAISSSESYELTRVLDRLKPADARFVIDGAGVATYIPTKIRQAVADSNFWEVTTSVVPTHTYQDTYVTLPSPAPAAVPQPVPKPPFVTGQSMAWSYATDVIGISAYEVDTYTWNPWYYYQPWSPAYYYNYSPFYNNNYYRNGYYNPYDYDGGYWPYRYNYDPYYNYYNGYNYYGYNYGYNPYNYGYNGYNYGYDYNYGYYGSPGYYNRYNYNPYYNSGPYYGWRPYANYWYGWYGRITYSTIRSVVIQRSVDKTGRSVDFHPHYALVPPRKTEAVALSRALTANAYYGQVQHTYPDLAPATVGSFKVDELTAVLNGDYSPTYLLEDDSPFRFWHSRRRFGSESVTEIVEIRLAETKAVNQISYEVSSFPHRLQIAIGDENGNWDVIHEDVHNFCFPRYFRYWDEDDLMPWQHSAPGHFVYKEQDFATPIHASRIRIQLTRIDGPHPYRYNPRYGFYDDYEEFDYSLAIKNFNLGYAVASIQDLPVPVVPAQPTVIAVTKDILGSQTEYSLRQERASDMLDQLVSQWTCEPQPVSFAAVNFYLDVRDDSGNPVVIDRFYLEPTHPGPHLTLYYSNDPGEPSKDNTDLYNAMSWTPINRDYTLQKGYLQVPPTSAKHFKFEFTALTAAPFAATIPIRRTVRLFPAALVDQMDQGFSLSDEARTSTFLDSGATPISYRDAALTLRNTSLPSAGYSATEAVHSTADSPGMAQDLARVFQFQPWHQGGRAPRFTTIGVHTYDTIEIDHVDKVGYSVGLMAVQAYRQDFGADDDTQVYLEQLHDFRHIQPGFSFTFNPNSLTTETSGACLAQSTVLASRHAVRAIQFATQQTPAIQLIMDDDFRDPGNDIRDWTDVSGWHLIGDATIRYSKANHSVVLTRAANGATSTGGLESTQVGVANAGRVHAAVRLTPTTLQTPYRLQIVEGASNTLLAEKVLPTNTTTTEQTLFYDLQGEASIKVRLVQSGPSHDVISVDTLSAFDEGLVWDFSVNGGADWVTARGVRNNANALMTFPEPGTQLVWRLRGLRPHMAVSSLKIRPEYVGVQNARNNGAQRGPNVSTYDQDVPVQDDPLFTDWTSAIPKGWFTAYKRFPSLPIEGIPNVTEFARFYGRPVTDTPGAVVDSAMGTTLHVRTGTERMDFFQPISDAAVRTVYAFRSSTDGIASNDSASGFKFHIQPAPARLVNRPFHPVRPTS